MSGGSYNYLYCKDPSDIGDAIGDLTAMAERLNGLGYAPRAAAATERLLALLRDDGAISAAIADLSDVWLAVEWCDSCDSSEDQMRAEIERYEARPDEQPRPLEVDERTHAALLAIGWTPPGPIGWVHVDPNTGAQTEFAPDQIRATYTPASDETSS